MLEILFVINCFIAVGGSMICSLWEATLLTLNPVRLSSLQREGKHYAAIWLRLKRDIDRPISTILIINTLCNTGGATLAGSLFGTLYGNAWLGLFMAGLTLAILYVAEIGPKVIGATYAERLAPVLGRPLEYTTWVMSPLVQMTRAYSSFLRGGVKGDHAEQYSPTDIEVMAQMARSGNAIATEQERIIVNAAKLQDTTVRDIMIPRKWIVFFNLQLPVEENFKIGQHAMHTRYPVSYNDSPDDIMGYINYKDLMGFRMHGNKLNIESFIRPMLSLPPDTDLNSALGALSAKRHHIAIIKESDGGVLGMITMEDIIEEFLGEIEDEFDLSAQIVIPVTDNLWRMGAALTIEKVADIIEKDLVSDHPNQTLGQWLDKRLGNQHYPGMNYDFKNIKFTIQQARRGRIFQVIIETNTIENASTAVSSPS